MDSSKFIFTPKFIFIIFIGHVLAGLLAFIIVKVITKRNEKRRQYVLLTSYRYSSICSLNQHYNFRSLAPRTLHYVTSLNSKAQFDRFDYAKSFTSQINQNRDYYKMLFLSLRYNRDLLLKYKSACKQLPDYMAENSLNDLHFPYSTYHRLEETICKEALLSPTTDINITCHAQYQSPQGRNSYHGERVFNMQDLYIAFQSLAAEDKRKETAAYQRSLLSPKLRYKIFTRDNHRCTICGRSATDGITLHVDHIIPVSKGGKTVESNLRTLCNECNLGKSNSYTPGGLN